MASVNKVILVGNVGVDPEVRYLDGGASQNGQSSKVASFRLATTERFKDKEITEWHNIVAWRSTADIIEKYVHRGTQLYIEGRLRTRQWTDQTGNKRYTTEINVDNLQLLGRRSDGDGTPAIHEQNAPQPSFQRPAPQTAAAPAQPQQPISFEGGDDDFPF